jgi:hypothetical protein
MVCRITTWAIQCVEGNKQEKIQANVASYGCDQDFNLFKAGKNIQKEIEGMRAEMTGTINELLEAINNLKHEHQTQAVTKNKTAERQQAMVDEKRKTTASKMNGPTEERSRPQEADKQEIKRQMELDMGEREDGKEESSDRANQSKEVEEELDQHNEARTVDQRANQDEGEVEDQAGFEEVIYGETGKDKDNRS